jgi:hypothetical protein
MVKLLAHFLEYFSAFKNFEYIANESSYIINFSRGSYHLDRALTNFFLIILQMI